MSPLSLPFPSVLVKTLDDRISLAQELSTQTPSTEDLCP